MLRDDLYKPWFADEKWGVEIISGEFKDVIVQIVKLEFSESESGNAELEFETLFKPEGLDINSDLFNPVIELIINDILKEAIEIFENEKNRNHDTEKSTTE